MLYQSTSVGFGYGLDCRRCFLEEVRSRPNPIRDDTLSSSSRPGRLGNINPIPIGYGLRPRLRGPANPARINLAQEPLDFRREGFSPSLTLLMSAFALPIPPASLTAHLHRPTERSATTFRRQKTEIRYQNCRDIGQRASGQSPGTRPAIARQPHCRCTRDRGNRATRPAFRRPSPAPS
jgi:hypothetical protein